MRKEQSGVRSQDREINTVHCSLFTDNKGIALVMVLILSAIALAIMAGLVYMVVTGTQISGIEKRYKTALEAGMGGKEVAYQFIGMRGDPGIPNINFLFSSAFTDPCMIAKLNTTASEANWVTVGGCGGGDFSKATTISIDYNYVNTYDMQFDLGTNPNPTYRVYAKIVNTVQGNSGSDLGLTNKGVVNSNTGEVQVMSVPYLYTIEVNAQDSTNPQERAKLSILYEY